jgi:hypothetical protein
MKEALNYLLGRLTDRDLEAFHQWKLDPDAGMASFKDADADLACTIEDLHRDIVAHELAQRKLAALDQLAQVLSEIQK